ncbi:hypothetical protein BU24DRAFT_461608 [Aaosphaeria arxii CBS 175.79]|uniref:F-box domain-containing protein n=1 Tax=Aaosphaeria arxii CBS 175.79 TaxID=1450172 RepID=A0A6A5XQ08_9PLEO|nr:uncharacterized protein BU24DRAFT_461608 [Aaosphaeria arxii CBS 175.79]KAF2015355.1 hypothetical protein BU24DRAFT_461608 [Aaosphaeria arxii CBS 175.79]
MNTLPLPTELIIIIAEYLEPTFCLNFALASSESWRVCKYLLQNHTLRFKKCGDLDITTVSLRQKLRELISDPRKGWYYQRLVIPKLSTFWDEPHDEDCSLFHAEFDRIEIMYSRVRAQRTWLKLQNEGIRAHPEDRSDQNPFVDPMITVLVHYLPYLKVLTSPDFSTEGALWAIMQSAVLAYSQANLSLAVQLPFQHLTTVVMTHEQHDQNVGIDPGWVLLLNRIPSVRQIAAEKMQWNFPLRNPGEDSSSIRLPESNVEEYFFVQSYLDPPTVQTILASPKSIKRFTFECNTLSLHLISIWRETIEILRERTGQTLEHLVLEVPTLSAAGSERLAETWIKSYTSVNRKRGTASKSSEFCTVSFRDFRVLKTLRTVWSILWTDLLESSTLASQLPDSLEVLDLEVHFFNEHEWKRLVIELDGLFHVLPKLQSIYAEDPRYGHQYCKCRTNELAEKPYTRIPGSNENPLMRLLRDSEVEAG